MTVIVPCDYHETIKAVKAAAEIVGPVVVRFGREKVPVITTPDTPFEVGKAQVFRDGFDVTIMACGVMVYESLKAARMLEEEGVSARVLNCPTVKPMDIKAVVESALETGAVVTAEEHQVMGGFGSAVAEVLCRHAPVPVRMVGIQDVFGQSGSPEELMESYGLTAQAVAGAVRDVLEMKKR